MKLSIITINLNNAAGLKRTVLSVRAQDLEDCEFIVVDGYSSDGSLAILENHKDVLDKFISEKDSGVYEAMNKGISLASGEYLLFLNSGDHFYDENSLKMVMPFLKDKDLYYSHVNIIKDSGPRVIKYPRHLRFSHFYSQGFCHQCCYFHKRIFEKIGPYSERYKIVSDWKLLINMIFRYNCTYERIEVVSTTFYADGLSFQSSNVQERSQVLHEDFDGFIKDYDEYLRLKTISAQNRHKLLMEAEKTKFGKKIMSVWLRMYVFLFSKKRLNEVLDGKK